MDCIPLPNDSVRERPRIQYFCDPCYDRGDFLTYPDRVGWSVEEVHRTVTWNNLGKEGYKTAAQARSFLQSWLFFGILHVVYGDPLSFDDFIETDSSGNRFVHTKNLAGVAQKALEWPARDARWVYQCVLNAYGVQKALANGSPRDPDFVVFLGLFLHILPQFFTPLREKMLNDAGFWPPVPKQPETSALGDVLGDFQDTVSYFSSELMLGGWCPQQIERLQTTAMCFQYAALYMLPPDTGKDHSKCTQGMCLAYQMDRNTYQHRHLEAGCHCDHVQLELDGLCSVLEDGGIPVAVPSAWGSGHFESLSLRSTDEVGNDYVAISHVWSDGLGNPSGNSMAVCQIRRICKLVSQLPEHRGTPCMWIDTLCCPVKPKEKRNLAISRMRRTYQDASCVLILDEGLQKLAHRSMSVVEIIARISSSLWNTRMWTWQEGALPKACYIQFSDGVLDIEDLKDGAMEGMHSIQGLSYFEFREAAMLYWRIRGRPNARGTKATARFELMQIATALDGRATSVAGGEAVCIGAMMNCDLLKILRHDSREHRMCAFWEDCPLIPREILFWTLTRLSRPGFRWAPDTLSGVGASNQLEEVDGEQTGWVTAHGLRVRGTRSSVFLHRACATGEP